MPHIYHVLSQLGSLPDVLHNLRHRLLRDLILPAVFPSKGQSWRVEESRADSLSILRLEASPQPRSPGDILSGISTILAFIATTVFPPSPTSPPNREAFLSDLQTAALQAFLDHVILPDMPSTMASIHTWLETVHAAMKFEASLIGTNCTKVIVQPFFESAAGPAWAAQRRRRVAEEVRRLILNGWGGWEAVEVEREKEVAMMEEVEMGDAGEENELVDRGGKESDDEMDFGWNFGEEEKERPAEAGTAKLAPDPAMDIEARDDGWQFGDTSNAAGASKPRQSPPAEPNGDGWVFDEVSDPVPKPVALPKPAREAKRLGKKAAKVKTVAEDDVWGSESTSIASSAQQNGHAPAPVQADAWVGWTNDESLKPESDPAIASAPSSVPKAQSAKPRKKAIREVRRTIKETSMISRACEKLLETAERVLREALELQSTE